MKSIFHLEPFFLFEVCRFDIPGEDKTHNVFLENGVDLHGQRTVVLDPMPTSDPNEPLVFQFPGASAIR